MSAPTNSALSGHHRADYVSALATYRHDFRQYLRKLDVTDEWRAAAFTSAEDGLAHDAIVMARLNADGWNRFGWPEAAGGLGGNEIHRAAYYEELGQAMMPIPAQHWTLETLGPALIRFAPSLAAAHLPGYLSGTEWRGQSFSEPESGSDLAALRYPRGRRWRRRIRHQRPQDLDQPGAHGHPAAGAGPHRNAGEPTPRTDHDHGDADAPGVTIRPIALSSGRRELAEVFFDDVRVDRERIVGDVDGGWAVPMHLMQYERGMYGYAVLNKVLSELSRLREDMVNAGAMDAQRQRFARVYVDVAAAQARTATTVRRLAAGQAAGADISIDKLLFGRAEKEVNDLILEITRDQMVAGTGRGGAELDTARAEWWYSRAATVMGGTAEVQRGIIADHLLGLPKEKR